jgi:hypothetical protein
MALYLLVQDPKKIRLLTRVPLPARYISPPPSLTPDSLQCCLIGAPILFLCIAFDIHSYHDIHYPDSSLSSSSFLSFLSSLHLPDQTSLFLSSLSTIPPIQFLNINFFQNKSALFGTQPFYWYLTEVYLPLPSPLRPFSLSLPFPSPPLLLDGTGSRNDPRLILSAPLDLTCLSSLITLHLFTASSSPVTLPPHSLPLFISALLSYAAI